MATSETEITETEYEQAEEAELKEDTKKVFWIRFSLWALFGAILPIIFLVWRYKLFQVTTTMQLGGWGFIAIIIACVFGRALWKYIKIGMANTYSFLWQCVGGLFKIVLPIFALYCALDAIQESIAYMLQFLGILMASEAIAIPLNPMPKWVYFKTGETKYGIIDYYFKKKSEEEKK